MRMKLFIMMVLELFIWGAWLPLVWSYIGADGLNFTGTQQALIGSAFAIASVVGIFFSNQFADRNFSAERFMAFSHLVGGVAMLGLYFVKDFGPFFALMLVHSLFYVPTISVANALAFANLKDPQKEFGPVRMGGTIGWILAAWPLYFILGTRTGTEAIALYKYIFVISGVASLILAAYCLTLPHTPPKRATAGTEKLAWVGAFKLLAIPYLLVLFIVTFIDATIHNGYFLMAGGFLSKVGFENKWIMPIMSIGQVAEIVTMAMLGMVLKKLGWKVTMILGILGHAVRFGVFAFFPENQTFIVLVQVLHGICYAFFFATVYIFIDAAFPKDVRTSAQGLFNLLILGLGDLAAKWIFLNLQERLTGAPPDLVIDYRTLFLVPTGLSLVAAIMLALFFRPPKDEKVVVAGTPATAH
jgi:nucleoside transporter